MRELGFSRVKTFAWGYVELDLSSDLFNSKHYAFEHHAIVPATLVLNLSRFSPFIAHVSRVPLLF